MKHILLLFFLFGFVVDSLTLPGPTSTVGLVLGLVYILVIFLVLLLREGARSFIASDSTAMHIRIVNILSMILSFVLGSLLSYVLIYYTRSSDIIISGPLIFFIITIVAINEFAKSSRLRMLLDSLLFILSFTFYIIFAIPFLLRSVSDKVFLLAILVSTICALIYVSLMHIVGRGTPQIYNFSSRLGYKYYLNMLVAVPALIGCLYFTNIIPAVPLTLSGSDVYSKVYRDKVTGEYSFTGPSIKSWNPFVRSVANIHAGEDLYYYSTITAPSKLTANVNHSWQKYNNSTNSWDTVNNISFPIYGGREDGFRGYSMKTNMSSGLWRVLVNIGSRHIGSFKFEVK